MARPLPFLLLAVSVIMLTSDSLAKLPDPKSVTSTSAPGGIDRTQLNAGVDFGPLSNARQPYGYGAYNPYYYQSNYGFSSPDLNTYRPAGFQGRQAKPNLVDIFTSSDGSFVNRLWVTARDGIIAPMGENLIHVSLGSILGGATQRFSSSAVSPFQGGVDPYQWLRFCSMQSQPFAQNPNAIDPRVFSQSVYPR